MDETPYRLAYEAALRAITDQASVIESLRSRAGTIFAATALVTSFLGGQAFARVTREGHLPPFHPFSVSGAALLAFILLSVLTFIILWPFRVRFSISAARMIEIADGRLEANPVGAHESYRELALRYEEMYDYNSFRIKVLFWCFRLAIFFLLGEIAAWLIVIYRAKS
jgi:hypothetical protein